MVEQELKVKRDVKEQQRLRDEYDKIKFNWGPMQSYNRVRAFWCNPVVLPCVLPDAQPRPAA